jgi:hypothetical protein
MPKVAACRPNEDGLGRREKREGVIPAKLESSAEASPSQWPLSPRQALVTDAANALSAGHVNLIEDVLHAGHMTNGLLNQLLQIKARQSTGQIKALAFLPD